MKDLKNYLFLLLALFASFAFAGCNTVDGMAQDVEAAAEEVDEEID